MNRLAKKIAHRHLQKKATSAAFLRSRKVPLPETIKPPNDPLYRNGAQSERVLKQWFSGVIEGKKRMTNPGDLDTGQGTQTMIEARRELSRNPKLSIQELRKKGWLSGAVPPQYEVAYNLYNLAEKNKKRGAAQIPYWSGVGSVAKYVLGVWRPRLPEWNQVIDRVLWKEFKKGPSKPSHGGLGLPF